MQIESGGFTMQGNLFYSKNNNCNKKNIKNGNFKIKKENTLSSLYEVENFLSNYKHFIKYIKLYNLFKY